MNNNNNIIPIAPATVAASSKSLSWDAKAQIDSLGWKLDMALRNALGQAAKAGNLAEVERLLGLGVRTEYSDAYFYAMLYKRRDIALRLARAGAKPETPTEARLEREMFGEERMAA